MSNKLPADVQDAAKWNPNDKERDATTYAAIIIDFLSKVIHGLSTGAVYDGIELNMESAKGFFSKLVKVLEVKETRITGATAEAEKLQQAEKQIKDLKEALQNLVDELPKGESLRHYCAKEQLVYARGILVLYNQPK